MIELNNSELNKVLSEFSAKVEKKEFKKIDYQLWRKLVSAPKVAIFLHMNQVYIKMPDIAAIGFGTNDYSLGDFLYWKYFATKITEEKNKCYSNRDMAILNEKKEDNKTMKGFNFDFGPCNNDYVRMSIYGLAVKNNSGAWVSYNSATGQVVDVDVFNFDGGRFMYKMPVAISDVAKGDIIIHNRVPMFVTEVNDNNTLSVVDVRAGEAKQIIPTANMFGFNFVTKIVSMFNALGSAPTPEQPFGNMLPWLMMDEDDSDGSIDPVMMCMMMNQGNMSAMINNPMFLYFMMKDNDDDQNNKNYSKMLPFLFMTQNLNNPMDKNKTSD